MQSVSAAWSAEEIDSARSIEQNLQISWHNQSTLGSVTFTIGVSRIGGNDIIGINPGAIGSPGIYKYFDETQYVTSLSWERGLKIPQGGLSMAMADAKLDNTSGRFTPRYMGGSSELYTAIEPNKPAIINAGFNFGGIAQVIPQFSGIVHDQPQVDMRSRTVSLSLRDYVDFFSNKYLDQAVMFTAQRTDRVIGNLLAQLGMSTAQYELDEGINTIPFGVFDVGVKFADAIDQLVAAENGQFYQDEQGIFRFENRQHWYSDPYNSPQRIIYTAQVLDAQAPSDDHLINVIEVKTPIYKKIPESVIFKSAFSDSMTLPAGQDTDIFVNFTDPTLSINTPTQSGASSYFKVNAATDGSGSDLTSSVTISKSYVFAQSAKFTFHNASASTGYITDLQVTGRQAKQVKQIDYKDQDNSSITAFQERPFIIDNPFIQNESWAASLASLLLGQYSDIENLQIIKIRAIPELQLGDLISWQGHYWRIYNIKATLDPSMGFVQELTMLQRPIVHYFTIGVSTIGGTDQIAP